MTDSLRERVIAACSARPRSVEAYPFGSVSLRCDPDLAAGLRRRHAAITAGYHLNKRHWNTVTLDGSVPEDELLDLIDHSYELVVARLPRAERDMLNT
jgi:predicted DNA-binding protein (MmcQ/YjbR family)